MADRIGIDQPLANYIPMNISRL